MYALPTRGADFASNEPALLVRAAIHSAASLVPCVAAMSKSFRMAGLYHCGTSNSALAIFSLSDAMCHSYMVHDGGTNRNAPPLMLGNLALEL